MTILFWSRCAIDGGQELQPAANDETGATNAVYVLLLHYFIILEGVSVSIAAPPIVGLGIFLS
ncbi:MAG: hypothetical protein WBD58_03860 [Geitlerinemataceae cyanobacterium]